MKRLICLILAAVLLLPLLNGCGEQIKEPVTFYYLRRNYREEMDGLIACEEREASGHRDSLEYLLAFYLMGPVDEELRSPLPRGTILFSLHQEGTELTLSISDTSSSLTDYEFSLACACLSLTCMDLVSVEEVTVTSGSRSLTLGRDSLTLTDNIKPEETTK